MTPTLRIRLVALLLPAAVAGVALAGDWPQFRGPHRDGISAEKGILKSWPEGGPSVLWRARVGDGYSHLVVAKGRLYTLFAEERGDVAAAFDAATGVTLWKTPIDTHYVDGQGDGPRSTPVVDGDLVYTLSAKGKLHALAAATGKPVWHRDLVADFGARPPQWGVSTTPLVEGNLLLVDVGGSGGKGAIAFDKRTGKVAWTSPYDGAGYSAPIAFTVGGVRQVVFFTASTVSALAPANGKLLWRVPWRTSYDVNAATPIFVPPDRLFVASGYDTGAALFKIAAGDGGAGAREVWRSRGMKNQFSSSVLHGGHIYGFDNTTFKCIAAATGEEKWKQRGFGHGSLLLADGHLFVLSDRGKLALVEATPEAYREKASAEVLTGKCWTAPTLANGILYVRNQKELKALAVSTAAAKGGPRS